MRIRGKIFWAYFGALLVVMQAALSGNAQALTSEPSKVQGAPASAPVVVEAEATPQGPVATDATASGGKYVAAHGDYQPLFAAALPESDADQTIWARVRGTTVQLKGVDASGKQREFEWAWDKPARWTWLRLGRHGRSELGVKIVVVQGPGAVVGAGLDAVIFSADAAFDPNATLPGPPVVVTVDWARTAGRATSLAYGLNAFGGFDPKITSAAQYQAGMAFMQPGLIRLHNWGMLTDSSKEASGWVDEDRHSWDATRIAAALRPQATGGAAYLINIPGWPRWMADEQGFLRADQQNAFATFCADLVRIVNHDLQCHIRYWEITNERDDLYYKDFHADGGRGPLKDPARADRLDELAAIYTTCARAMKTVDPAIQTGGPAMARPDFTDFVRRFAMATAADLDFFSCHSYASGSKDDSDEVIYDRAENYAAITRPIQEILPAVVPGRPVPIFIDEYNISWSWENRDPRMTNNKGAVYDALSIINSVNAGAAGTTAWNEKDGVYGKMDDSFHLRPAATLFHWLNRNFVGALASVATTDNKTVVPYAVLGDHGPALLLVNRSGHPCRVMLFQNGRPKPATLDRSQIAGTGTTLLPAVNSAGLLTLPPDSVTLLTTGQ